MNALPTVPIKDLKTENVLENRFITVHLSNKLLEKPLPLHCLVCPNFLRVAIHEIPDTIVDAEINQKDCTPLFDVRCSMCKINYRFIK